MRFARSRPILPYGAPIPLADAKRVLIAAQAEAAKNKWNVAIAVVDSGGHLVAFERMDTTQYGSVEVAQDKARTSVAFRTAVQGISGHHRRGWRGHANAEAHRRNSHRGRTSAVVDGKIVGAIGVSGVTSAQDGQIAAAGLAVLK